MAKDKDTNQDQKNHANNQRNNDAAAHENADDASRRRFLQGSVATATGALLSGAPVGRAEAAPSAKAQAANGKRPNILILMCDENRFPPVYESTQTKAYRQTFLNTQNLLRQNGVDFQRHYAASVACSPSRTSIYTGQYPSLSDDPMELSNLAGDGVHTAQQVLLSQLLEQQRCAKRLVPQSGDVPGQPTC